MKIWYIGHACFLVEGEKGPSVLLDPFRPGAFNGRLSLAPFRGRVDVVASTHAHEDHFYLDPAFGEPEIVRSSALAAGIRFEGFEFPHGAEPGRDAGKVTGLRFELDGVSVFHPGDIGRKPTESEAVALGRIDVLLVPVGGTFTIDAAEAMDTIRLLGPSFALPMHYRTQGVDLRIAPLEPFLALAGKVHRLTSPMRIQASDMPGSTQIVVLEAGPVVRGER